MPQKNKITFFVLAFIVIVGLGSSGLALIQKFSPESEHTSNNRRTKPTPLTKSGKEDQAKNSNSEKDDQVIVPSGNFNYSGTTSWAPINAAAEQAMQAAHSGFHMHYVAPTGQPPSSSVGIKMLIDGKVNFAESYRPISNQEYKQAQQRGFTIEQIPVAVDGVAVAVNPKLSISGLTIDQLKSIYTGKIVNWKQLGGPNLAIKPYTLSKSDGAIVELFEQNVMSGQPFGPNVKTVPSTTQALKTLADNPGGIYYASGSEVVPQCNVKLLPLGRESGKFVPPYQQPLVPPSQCPDKRNQVNLAAFENQQYPITSLLYVIVKQNGQIDQKAGEAYANFLLTKQGQELVTQAGFIKMR